MSVKLGAGVVGALVLLLFADRVFAANPDNGPGCGLGKLAWSDYSAQKQILPQVFMFTTNGTFSSGAFGISFGTSGCTNDGVIMKNKHINLAESAAENVLQDVARGEGEHLTALVSLLGVPVEDRPRLFAWLQNHYSTLTPTTGYTALTLLSALEAGIAEEGITLHQVVAEAAR